MLKESPRWLLISGKPDKALQVLTSMARENGQNIPDEGLPPLKRQATGSAGGGTASIGAVFPYPALRTRLFAMGFIFLANSMVYYGLSLNVGSLGGIHLSEQLSVWISGDALVRLCSSGSGESREETDTHISPRDSWSWLFSERISHWSSTNSRCFNRAFWDRSFFQHDFSLHDRAFPNCGSQRSLGIMLPRREAWWDSGTPDNPAEESASIFSFHHVRGHSRGGVLHRYSASRNKRGYHGGFVRGRCEASRGSSKHKILPVGGGGLRGGRGNPSAVDCVLLAASKMTLNRARLILFILQLSHDSDG